MKNLDFSVWVSENLYKIAVVVDLTATVAALFFLHNVGDTAMILCFEKQTHDLEKIVFPCVDWNSIAPIRDMASKFTNFRTQQWIMVSVSSYPSDSLRGLVKIKGRQVLVIGNSRTPTNWSLKGAIYLSLEIQANLGFRVVEFLVEKKLAIWDPSGSSRGGDGDSGSDSSS